MKATTDKTRRRPLDGYREHLKQAARCDSRYRRAQAAQSPAASAGWLK